MNKQQQLGVYWGYDKLYFVQTEMNEPVSLFYVPLEKDTSQLLSKGPASASGERLIALISNTFRKINIMPTSVNLTLPTKDIIFRSFVIPWMQASELKGVVTFEASKYIPFSLDELSYSFHPLTINEGGTRRIRIVFVAIKKMTLNIYTSILEQASLPVEIVDPAPVSLIRTLIHKGLLQTQQTMAFIEKSKYLGKITIVDQGIPQFVREFQLQMQAVPVKDSVPNSTINRLINEVRISLDYFNRQNNQLKVNEILLLSSTMAPNLDKQLSTDLSLPVKMVTSSEILANDNFKDLGYLNAFGVGLTHSVETAANFELSGNEHKIGKVQTSNSTSKRNIKSMVITGVISLALILLSFFLAQFALQKPEEEIVSLKQDLGEFQDSTKAWIEDKTLKLNNKLKHIEKLPIQSDIFTILKIVPTAFPKGTWIKDINIIYPDNLVEKEGKNKDKKKKSSKSKKAQEWDIQMKLTGYAYMENQNEQFRLVNMLQKKLKNDKDIQKIFNRIELETLLTEKINNKDVTFFQIRAR